jgi:hypothetical protein
MGDKDKTEIIGKYSKNEYLIIFLCLEFLSKAPSNLTTDDLEDFCSLAHHYASNTPQSFRKVSNQKT